MVGGAISGYWAMGSVESAITPTSVMTMLITPAKIGRSMKKCGKFMARLTSGDQRSSLRSACLCGCGRLLRNRLHVHPGLQQLETRGDNLLSVLKTAFHNPFAFEKGAGFKGAALNRIIGFHNERV